MKGVLIDETTLDARIVDYDPKDLHAVMDPVCPGMDCLSVVIRSIEGRNYAIFHDDEFLFRQSNVTGICGDYPEILKGSLLICAEAPEDLSDEEFEECRGLRDMTESELGEVMGAWHPVSPEEAQKLAKDIHQSLLFLMGSNALHYSLDVEEGAE